MLNFLIITLIQIYRLTAPLRQLFFMPCCRYIPSCSQYAIESLSARGTIAGSLATLNRLIRCHPFHPGGYDPVAYQDLSAHSVKMQHVKKPAAQPGELW